MVVMDNATLEITSATNLSQKGFDSVNDSLYAFGTMTALKTRTDKLQLLILVLQVLLSIYSVKLCIGFMCT